MRHFLFLIVFAFLTFFSYSNLYATNGMRMIGFGPVQNSMGGTSVGVTLDAASILTNPAGMSDIGGRIDFGATYFNPTVKYKAVGASPGYVANDGLEITSDRGASPIPAFGLVLPITQDLSFGIGAYGVAGMGVDYKKNLYSNETYSSYSQMRFTPAVSYRINDIISVGVGINAMYATMEFLAGSTTEKPHMGASSFGYGATVGAKVKPLKELSIGVAYETESVFQDFVFNTTSGQDKLKFNQPDSLTGGLSYILFDSLTIAFDIQWINWSSTNGKNKPSYSQNSSGAGTWNMNWKDQIVYKAGIQYIVNQLFTVRAGYNYGKMPLDKTRAFENIAFPAIAEHHITFGFGINFSEKLTLNGGATYSPESSLSGSNAAAQGISSYKTSMSQFSVDLGLAYKF